MPRFLFVCGAVSAASSRARDDHFLTVAGARTRARAVANPSLRDPAQALEPQQLHLALTGVPTEMLVQWVTYNISNGTVSYAPTAGGAPATADAYLTTYTGGLGGWSGWIHTAVMTGLTPGSMYTYSVGSGPENTPARWSMPRTFSAAPAPSAALSSYVAVTADMGTIDLLGWAVSGAITEQHLLGPKRFDLVTIAGDLSYATIDPPKDEVQWSWDSWQMQVEPYASTAPFMTTVGACCSPLSEFPLPFPPLRSYPPSLIFFRQPRVVPRNRCEWKRFI